MLKEKDKFIFYRNLYVKTAKQYQNTPEKRILLQKLFYYSVMVVKNIDPDKQRTVEDVEMNFKFISNVIETIGQLTPFEIMQIFPIEKKYDGAKYQEKDYFTTKRYVDTLPLHEPICNTSTATDFLWKYHNYTLMGLWFQFMCSISDMCIVNGEKTPFEQFVEDKGITTYTLHKDQNGKEFLIDSNTGKTQAICRPKQKPKYIKIVK